MACALCLVGTLPEDSWLTHSLGCRGYRTEIRRRMVGSQMNLIQGQSVGMASVDGSVAWASSCPAHQTLWEVALSWARDSRELVNLLLVSFSFALQKREREKKKKITYHGCPCYMAWTILVCR